MSTNLTGTATVSLPAASSTQLGGVMIQTGSNLSVDSSGNLSATTSVPVAKIITITSNTQNVQIDNSADIFILDNSSSNAYLMMFPQSPVDGQTFRLVATTTNGPVFQYSSFGSTNPPFIVPGDIVSYKVPSSYNANDLASLLVPSTFRYVSSISKWVQIEA